MAVASDPSTASAGNPAAERCAANKTNGDPCPQPAMRGQTVCYVHGGAAPQNRRAAARRLAQAEANKQLAEMDYEPVSDPIATLADVAGRSVALMDWFEARVEALHQQLRYESSQVGTEQLRSEVVLLERAMDRVGKLASRLAELGYQERRVRVEEAQAVLVAVALQAALEQVGVPVELRQPVLEAFAVALPEAEQRQAIEASSSA